MNGWICNSLLVVGYLRGEWWVDVYVGSWEVDWVILCAGWLIYCLVSWLFSWLVASLAGWLVVCLCGCVAIWLFGCLVGWLFACLVV